MKKLIIRNLKGNKWIVIGCILDGHKDYCVDCSWFQNKKFPCDKARKVVIVK